MANSNFVVNAAQFTPLSFDDYYKPLAILNEQHQKLDDAYLELYTKASTIEQMANEQTDPEAYKQYKTYADDLRSAINVLDKNGLTPNSRRDMLMMARRYGDEIAPIQGAYTRRASDITAQREALSKDQTVRFSRKASESSLMDYMNNPSLSYESMSGAQITADVSNKVKNLKNQLLSGTGEWKKTLGGQQFERILQYGLTPDVMYDIMQNPDKYPMFKELIQSAVNASGVSSWGSPDDLEYALHQAYNGLWEGIGTDKPEMVENKDLDRAYKYEQILNARTSRLKAAQKEKEEINGRHFDSYSGSVRKFEQDRLARRNSDIKFIQSLSESGKQLKEKDKQKLNEIESIYGIKAYRKNDGTVDYTNLMNVMASMSNPRASGVYYSNLTDASTILNIIGYDARNSYNPKNGKIKDSDMDLMFTTTGKKWGEIEKGKSNGVTKTSMDVLTDILNSKSSKIAVDPMNGTVIIQQNENNDLGDIILYDRARDNNRSRVLDNKTFSTNLYGRNVNYSFTELINALSDLERYDRLSANDLRKIVGDENVSKLTREDINTLNSMRGQYFNNLMEAFFGGIVSINNAVSPAHGMSGNDYNISIPIE